MGTFMKTLVTVVVAVAAETILKEIVKAVEDALD